MYYPSGTHNEFIELMNLSETPLPLFDPANPQNTWRIVGVDFNFPPGVELAPREIVLVVPVDPATFRATYAIDPAIRIFGPFPGALSNGGELIRLRKPDGPTLVNGVSTVPYIDMDNVNYGDRSPWPSGPDGLGPSLERINPAGFADDPGNWRASVPNGGTPGTVEFPEPPPLTPYTTWLESWDLAGEDAGLLTDPDDDNLVNLLEYAFVLDPTKTYTAKPGLEEPDGLPVIDRPTPDTLSLIYRQNPAATDLAYTVEFSETLSSTVGQAWQPAVVSESVVFESANLRVIRATIDTTGMNTAFLRLRVEKIPL
jgi:hypothetical protein